MRSSLIWVCTVCSDLTVPIFKIITVYDDRTHIDAKWLSEEPGGKTFPVSLCLIQRETSFVQIEVCVLKNNNKKINLKTVTASSEQQISRDILECIKNLILTNFIEK